MGPCSCHKSCSTQISDPLCPCAHYHIECCVPEENVNDINSMLNQIQWSFDKQGW